MTFRYVNLMGASAKKTRFVPLREYFHDGFDILSPSPRLRKEVKICVTLFLRKSLFLLKVFGLFWEFLHLPSECNVWKKIHEETKNSLRAPLYAGENNYFTFEDNPYRIIQIAGEARPALVTYPGNKIAGKAFIEEDSRVRFGIALNEEANPGLLEYDCKVTWRVSNHEHGIQDSFVFPVQGRNELFAHKLGESWIDWYVDVPLKKPCEWEISLYAEFIHDKKKKNSSFPPAVVWSAPQVLSKVKRRKCRKIIHISVESLSDPLFLQYNLQYVLDIPNYNELMKHSTVYQYSYSQGDATLTVAGSFLTGLLASQHGITDYTVKSWDISVKNLSPKIQTIAEMLKEHGFYTQADIFQSRFSPRYGWYRGFDSYKYSRTFRNSPAHPARLAINFLDEARDHDAFLFMHWDGLHGTYWVSEPCNRMVVRGDNGNGEIMSVKALYCERLHYLDTELGILINYLKSSGLWDESLIILTGDHGLGGVLWKKHGDFALYDERIRVPFVVKRPEGSSQGPERIEIPTNASISALSIICSTLDIPLSSDQENLPQWSKELEGIAISETVMHPEHHDYALALISNEYKYFFRCKINWEKVQMDEFLYDKLFRISNGKTDEVNDISYQRPKEVRRFKELAVNVVQSNLAFLRSHLPVNLTDLAY